MKVCTIEGCGRQVVARQRCQKHYRDHRKTDAVWVPQRPTGRPPKAPTPCAAPGCGKTSKCKGLCKSHYAKDQKASYRPRRVDRALRANYGLTAEQRHEMLVRQEGKCGICERPLDVEASRGLFVDHCHTSKEVRGLLCLKCNLLLGHANDNPDTLYKAIAYLAAPPSREIPS